MNIKNLILSVAKLFSIAFLAALWMASANAQSLIQPPDTVKSAGTLRIATYMGYPPIAFERDGQFVGAEIELGKAIAERLGVTASFTNVPFEGLIPGLLSGRYDFLLSTMSDTEPRRKQVDFVDYGQAFTSIIVPKGNPKNINNLDDLCGLPVATVAGSSQSVLLDHQSEKCKAGGKPAITLTRFPSQAQVGLDMRSGRSAAVVRDFALGLYEVEQSAGALEVARSNGKPAMVGGPGKLGIAIKKGDPAMTKALLAALQSLKADGTYLRIYKKWNLTESMISDFTVNDGNN